MDIKNPIQALDYKINGWNIFGFVITPDPDFEFLFIMLIAKMMEDKEMDIRLMKSYERIMGMQGDNKRGSFNGESIPGRYGEESIQP